MRETPRTWWPPLAIGLLVTVMTRAMALACPNCAAALEGNSTGLAFYWSTLFLSALPFVVLGAVGGWVSYQYWRAARDATADTAAPHTTEPSGAIAWWAASPDKEIES